MHMRDRPSAYEAACIDQPKSATTPGVLSASLAFFGTTAEGGGAARCLGGLEEARGGERRTRAGWVGRSAARNARETERGDGGGSEAASRPSPTDARRDVTPLFLYLSLFPKPPLLPVHPSTTPCFPSKGATILSRAIASRRCLRLLARYAVAWLR